MRALIGLAALAAAVNAQTITIDGSATGTLAGNVAVGQTALAQISVYQLVNGGTVPQMTPAAPNGQGFITSSNWAISALPNPIHTLVFNVVTNPLTAQMQYRWSPNYPNPATLHPGVNGLSIQSYTCDTCAGGTAISCNTATGPGPTGATPPNGYACASLTRIYTFSGISASTPTQTNINAFSVQVLDKNTQPGPNTSSYSFQIVRVMPPIIGDPQIYGLQGQDFQVHGVPDEIFNMVSYPNLQVNARFVYLSSGECHDNYTACFAHPGTYISEEGIRVGSDKIHVRAGAAKKGLTVSVNGKKLSTGKQTVKLGSVELINHRRVEIKTPIMAIVLTNSDKFLNQEAQVFDRKLLALGAERRVLKDGQKFHSEVPLHGLQGQTWRNVEYPSGLEYEGTISDYQIQDGNLWGTNFVFNQYQA